MIDTHCHLTYKPLLERVDAVVARARGAGVDRMISVGTSLDDARVAVGLTERYEGVYATVGVHPHYAQGCNDRGRVMGVVHELAGDPRVVAVGEMGLDKHYNDPPIEDQRRVFAWQLDAARELTKPIVIHNRQATDEVLGMIGDSGIGGERFVFHCFTGSGAELDAILETGAMVSFTGVVTFKNSKALAECAVRVPIERLMIETDSPYLTPEPYRKVRPNEPCYVPWVAKFIAGVRGMDEGEFVSAVDGNTERFFGLV